jgi:hypothetical protein
VGGEEDVGDDLFSTKGWRHQKSGSAYGGDGDAIYVSMKKLAKCSGKLIFDKQDRFVHPAAIARMTEKKTYYISTIKLKKEY